MTQTIPLKATLLLRHKRILRHRGTHLNWRLREQDYGLLLDFKSAL